MPLALAAVGIQEPKTSDQRHKGRVGGIDFDLSSRCLRRPSTSGAKVSVRALDPVLSRGWLWALELRLVVPAPAIPMTGGPRHSDSSSSPSLPEYPGRSIS